MVDQELLNAYQKKYFEMLSKYTEIEARLRVLRERMAGEKFLYMNEVAAIMGWEISNSTENEAN